MHGDLPKATQKKLIHWLQAYSKGALATPLQFPLDLTKLPPFSNKVLTRLKNLSFGEFITYKKLAELAGNPKAFRAVGQACHINPYPLFIPCHRVISSTSLGGFSLGIDIKKELYSFEKMFIHGN